MPFFEAWKPMWWLLAPSSLLVESRKTLRMFYGLLLMCGHWRRGFWIWWWMKRCHQMISAPQWNKHSFEIFADLEAELCGWKAHSSWNHFEHIEGNNEVVMVVILQDQPQNHIFTDICSQTVGLKTFLCSQTQPAQVATVPSLFVAVVVNGNSLCGCCGRCFIGAWRSMSTAATRPCGPARWRGSGNWPWSS